MDTTKLWYVRVDLLDDHVSEYHSVLVWADSADEAIGLAKQSGHFDRFSHSKIKSDKVVTIWDFLKYGPESGIPQAGKVIAAIDETADDPDEVPIGEAPEKYFDKCVSQFIDDYAAEVLEAWYTRKSKEYISTLPTLFQL